MAFESMSGDPDQEYFSDGISEELLNLLAKIPELTVISRSSAFSCKGKDIFIPTIAAQLAIAKILMTNYGSIATEEARRIGNRLACWVDLFEARFDEAIRQSQEMMRQNPDSRNLLCNVADELYFADRIDEALPVYERLREFVPDGRPLPGYLPAVRTIRLALALARRQAGDDAGAQAAAQIAKLDIAARRVTGRKDWEQDLGEAMIASFERNSDRTIAALKSAIQHGLRVPKFLDDPILEDLRTDPRFISLREELDAIIAIEHDRVLQLI